MERKLRLVPPADDGGSPGNPGSAPVPPAAAAPSEDAVSGEERAAAESLRDALDRGDEPLAAELHAAFAPAALAEDDLDALLARAMGDESAATRAEREAADRLRAELEGAAPGAVREAAVLLELRMAASPPALDPAKNEALIEAALSRAGAPRVIAIGRRSVVRRLAPLTMAALAGVAALAAGFALFFGQAKPPPPGTATALIRARSTEELFDAATPFPRSGEESARIDRIAAARASDLRANRFAAWGVR